MSAGHPHCTPEAVEPPEPRKRGIWSTLLAVGALLVFLIRRGLNCTHMCVHLARHLRGRISPSRVNKGRK